MACCCIQCEEVEQREPVMCEQASCFLPLLSAALQSGQTQGLDAANWAEMRQSLLGISRESVRKKVSSIETARLIFLLKDPLFAHLRTVIADDARTLAEQTTAVGALFDKLGLFMIEV